MQNVAVASVTRIFLFQLSLHLNFVAKNQFKLDFQHILKNVYLYI